MSIIELLVVIAVIGILIAVTLPALASSRRQAKLLDSVARTKSLAASLTMAVDDNAGRFMITEVGKKYHRPAMFGLDAFSQPLAPWMFRTEWYVTHDIGRYSDAFPEILLSPTTSIERRRSPWPLSYELTTAVGGDPRLWPTPDQADLPVEDPVALRGPQALAAIHFPSIKAMLSDGDAHAAYPPLPRIPEPPPNGVYTLRVQTPVAAMDGSAFLVHPDRAVIPVRNLDPKAVYGLPLIDTPGGIHGRDFTIP